MPLMDEFREEREAIKHASVWVRLAYFFDYYKWHTLVCLFVFAFVATIIFRCATVPEYVLNGYFINAQPTTEHSIDTLRASFIELYRPKSDETNYMFDTSQKFIATGTSEAYYSNFEIWDIFLTRSAAQELDFMIGDALSLSSIGYRNYFTDLRTILTEEQFQQYEPYMLYIDGAILDNMNSIEETMEGAVYTFPSASSPQEMETPIPVMIDISSCTKLAEIYDDSITDLAFGIVCTNNLEISLEFLNYILLDS